MYQVITHSGLNVIVTGASSGIGKQVATRMAVAGAAVTLAVRSGKAGDAARNEILRSAPGAMVTVKPLDLANLSSVREFVDDFTAEHGSLDVLINNAGTLAHGARQTTADNFELHFGTNALGPLALTVGLIPLLLRAASPRVSFMGSEVGRFARIHLDDLQWEHRRFNANAAYGQSKLADILMGVHLAHASVEHGWALRSTVAHPGYTITNLVSGGSNSASAADRSRTPFERIFPTQGVEAGSNPILFAATDPRAANGAYYGPGGFLGLVGPTVRIRLPRPARHAAVAAELWHRMEGLAGVSLENAAAS